MKLTRYGRSALAAVVLTSLVGAATAPAYAVITFTPFQVPGATTTYLTDIDNDTIVGFYPNNTGGPFYRTGFSVTGGVYTTIEAPDVNYFGTNVEGISGDTVVGYFEDNSFYMHGFSYTAGVFTILDAPGVTTDHYTGTLAHGISGNSIVGQFQGANHTQHGFILTDGVYTTLDFPGAATGSYKGTYATGISGSTVVGYYDSPLDSYRHGFVETNGVFTPLDVPGAKETILTDISGDMVIGYYLDFSDKSHGFIETNGVFTTIERYVYDESLEKYVTNPFVPKGISGNTIVGSDGYYGGSSFIMTIPEPASLALLALGALTVLTRRRKA